MYSGNGETKWPHFVLLGAMRSGTTSVFRYLAEHPAVCVGKRKELNYFVDYNDVREIAQEYTKEFAGCSDDAIRVEASPIYMAFPEEVVSKLRETVPGVKTAIFLREPVSRAVSIYKSIHRAGALRSGVTFDAFVDALLRVEPDLSVFADRDRAVRIWRQIYVVGRYTYPLEVALQCFGGNLFVGFLENLSHNPRGEMQRLCEFLQIAPEFYRNYTFDVENPSIVPRWPRLYRIALQVNAFLEPVLPIAWRRVIRSVHHALNQKRGQGVSMSPQTRNRLRAHYLSDLDSLLDLVRKANVPDEFIPAWVKGES